MMGVMVVEGSSDMFADPLVHPLGDCRGFIASFSGVAGKTAVLPYFVPPIFDITVPGGHFRKIEALITSLNREISQAESSREMSGASADLEKAMHEKEKAVSEMRALMASSKKMRDLRRKEGCSIWEQESMVRESQFEKAKFRRMLLRHDRMISEAEERLEDLRKHAQALREKRSMLSEELQQWIFRQYSVRNASGETADILEIFSEKGLVPPGGTGDCAAPKLLQYAYTHGLRPVSMGEFWYGKPSGSSLRIHGHFYPACTHKCGPLLAFMLRGLNVKTDNLPHAPEPEILYEDESVIAADKCSGELSLPGKTGEMSLIERLSVKYGQLYPVHRLDMDTSGVILFSRNPVSQAALQRQFEDGSVTKRYLARLCPQDPPSGYTASVRPLHTGESGTISIPISPDYEDRPRQKPDYRNGKEAVTEFEVLNVLPGGGTDVMFTPRTGRTHQLRIHSAHPDGLGRPILGDRLYGGCTDGYSGRMMLHALSVSFIHPATGERITISARNFGDFRYND